MDIPTIAAATVTALIPFLQKGGEKLAEKIGEKTAEEGFQQRKAIWETVKNLFIGDEITTLNLLAENPNDVEKQAEFKGELKYLLKNNPDIARQLEEMIKPIFSSHGKENIMSLNGNDNISIQDTKDSVIHINK